MGTRLFTLSILIPIVSAADTCLSQPQLFGVIFGSVAATLLICVAIAVILWFCTRSVGRPKKVVDAAALTHATDIESRPIQTQPKASMVDQMTMIDSFKLRKKLLDMGTQKSFSSEHINEVVGQTGVQLKSDDLSGLGFNIQGNMTDGIFIKNIVPKGIAEQCGNILEGDRIKSITVNFDSIVYEDAVTLLSYASPYKVKLELERRMDDSSPSEGENGAAPRLHPLFRSNTMQNIHFHNMLTEPLRCASQDTVQKHALPHPPVEEPKEVEKVEKIEEPKETTPTRDSTPTEKTSENDADVSRMESSDYASDNTSDYRESESGSACSTSIISTSDAPSQHTISDHVEITDIVVDKPVTITPMSPRIESCKELPPKPAKVVSRSPSPKVTSRRASPQVTTPEVVSRVEKVISIAPQVAEPRIPPPAKREAPPKARVPAAPKPPEIMEARVSRIPKKQETQKTPVIERKLPPLPKSVAQRTSSIEEKTPGSGDVWSRLYLDKKSALKKTHESGAGPAPGALSPSTVARSPSPAAPMSPPQSGAGASQDTPRYGTLSRERRERLVANDELLERQREELRELGVL